MTNTPAVGQAVMLNTPDNPRAHGQPAIVTEVTAWGYMLRTDFGSGRFRATAAEITGPPPAETRRKPAAKAPAPRDSGYTGESCAKCGSFRMVRAGVCSCCQDCGDSTSCS